MTHLGHNEHTQTAPLGPGWQGMARACQHRGIPIPSRHCYGKPNRLLDPVGALRELPAIHRNPAEHKKKTSKQTSP